MERVMIFIDGSNFYYGLKKYIASTKIDFSKFAHLLSAGRKLIRIYYYNAPLDQFHNPEGYRAQRKFFKGLKTNTPYLTLKLGRLERRVIPVESKEIVKILGENSITTFVEKGVDVNIAVDMLRLAYSDTYDTAILVSGDGDFATAVEAVKDRGKHVEHAFFLAGKAYHLQQACDKFIPLTTEYLKDCLLEE